MNNGTLAPPPTSRSKPATMAVPPMPRADWLPPELGEPWPYPVTLLPNGWGVSVADIDADLAGRMLATNTGNNRARRPSLMARYKTDMTQNRWRLTHQGIAFNRAGELHDGQNRLAACVDSDSVFRSLVFFGVGDESEMTVFDTGGPRSAADAARISRVPNIGPNDIAALRAFLYGTDTSRVVFTNAHMLEQVDRFSTMLLFLRTLPGTKHSKVFSAPVRGAIGRAFYHADPARLTRFSGVLTLDIPATDPGDLAAVQLHRHQSGNVKAHGSGRLGARDLYCRSQRAIRAFLDGEALSKLYATDADLFPLPTDEQIVAAESFLGR